MRYFVYEVLIRNVLLLLLVNIMAVEQGNKLQNGFDVLIVVKEVKVLLGTSVS